MAINHDLETKLNESMKKVISECTNEGFAVLKEPFDELPYCSVEYKTWGNINASCPYRGELVKYDINEQRYACNYKKGK